MTEPQAATPSAAGKTPAPTPAAPKSQAEPSDKPKLSNAELKARAKAEKQAKRQARKQAETGQASTSQSPLPSRPKVQLPPNTAKVTSPPSKASPTSPSQKPVYLTPTTQQRGRRSSLSSGSAIADTPTTPEKQPLEMYKHLYNQSHRENMDNISKEVHPTVLALGLQFRAYEICGSTARCIAMLSVFKKVIDSYKVPPDNSIARHFINHTLSPQIEFLRSCRSISISMGNAIRHLKAAIVAIDPSTPEDEAKTHLVDVIDTFIRERFVAADDLISKLAMESIHGGDVILTFSKSSLVQRVLIDAHKAGKTFRVIVVDGKPIHEGKRIAQDLVEAGIPVQYFLMTGVSAALRSATKVILGAHALMGNGALYSRVGTAIVATMAHERNLPVLVCSQTIKFTDKIWLDAITNNELAPPEQLIPQGPQGAQMAKMLKEDKNFHILNVMYDLTPVDMITTVVTEHGALAPSAVPAVIRGQEKAGTAF